MSPLAHAGIALALFAAITPVLGPAAGALLGVGLYFGREGAEAQRATGRPKAETWFVPFAPWLWPQQMVLDFVAPAAAVALASGVLSWLS